MIFDFARHSKSDAILQISQPYNLKQIALSAKNISAEN